MVSPFFSQTPRPFLVSVNQPDQVGLKAPTGNNQVTLSSCPPRLTILVAPYFIAVAALLYAFAVRRLLGLRLGGLRTLIAGVLVFLVASPIITALFGNNSTKNSGIHPALWFVILGSDSTSAAVSTCRRTGGM
jgi:hypothetical protein